MFLQQIFLGFPQGHRWSGEQPRKMYGDCQEELTKEYPTIFDRESSKWEIFLVDCNPRLVLHTTVTLPLQVPMINRFCRKKSPDKNTIVAWRKGKCKNG